MRVKIEFKDREGDEGFGTYDTHLDSIRAVGHVLNQSPFIELTWRRPARASKGERGYTNVPVMLASDTIASVTEAGNE